jgi:hypothetical protein
MSVAISRNLQRLFVEVCVSVIQWACYTVHPLILK